jgi:hypothetical protein
MDRARELLWRFGAPALFAVGLLAIALGNTIGGLAVVITAWSVNAAARGRRRRARLERLIDGATVGEVMETEPLVVPAQATLDTFGATLDGESGATVARVMRGADLLGLVGPREVAGARRDRWSTLRAADVMIPVGKLPILAPGDALRPAAEALGASGAPGFPVEADGRLAGVLTRLAVGRVLHERAVEAAAAREG